jgi:undecaprenyl-diphosphatase
MTSMVPPDVDQTHGASHQPVRSAPERGHRWTIERHLGLALWLLGAVIVVVMAVLAHQYREFPGDVGFSTWLQQLRHTPLAGIIEFPADIDEPKPGGVIAVAMIVTLLVMRRIIAGVCLALASFGADAVNVVINTVVARPRPHNVKVATLSGLGQYSFPSGHVVHVVGLFGFVVFLSILVVRSRAAARWWALPIQVICVYFLACVGLGRILRGDHWPSDVLAGYLVGALLLALAIQVYFHVAAWWRRHQEHAHAAHTPG